MKKDIIKVIVTLPVSDAHRHKIESACKRAEVHFVAPDGLTPEAVSDAEVIIGNVPHALLKHAARLRLLQLGSAGADGYPEAMPRGALLANSSGAYGLAISEHMLGQLLMIKKKLWLYYDNQRRSEWHDEGGVTGIEGSFVLSVGMGDIGGDFLRKCKALGAYTVGIRRTPREKPDYADEMHTLDELDELLPKADVVALSLPGSEASRHLMDERRLRLMKRGAVLINVGRGSAVVTDALVRVCGEGHIYAALDVTDPEPLPREHPLWNTPNVFITPHISGFFHLPQTLDRIVSISASNLSRYAEGGPIMNLVDSSTGYRRAEDRV